MRVKVVSFLAAVLALSLLAGAGSGQIPPDPIFPDNGELTLLNAINAIPLQDVENALDHFPVPFVAYCAAAGAAPTIDNQKAGSPKRLDCDRSLATGMGGNDVQVEVNTILLPTPHLRLNVNRLGSAPFAQDIEVLVAFPFDAFNGEDATLPGDPNLFFGYQSTGAFNGTIYPSGGQAPATMQFDFTPHILAGTSHTFDLTVATTGASNPIRFISGHFDGTSATGILNASAIGMLDDPVPASWTLGIGTTESVIDSSASALTNTALNLTWNSSAPTKALFNYLENETFPFKAPDYNSALIFNQMPTSAKISLRANEAAKTATLGWEASAPVGSILLLHNRKDGLSYTGALTDVPTKVDLTLHDDGSADLDVNANTLDGNVNVSQLGGFASTAGFFNWDVGYLHAGFENAPDLHVEYVAADKRFLARAVNAGESIDAVELQIDDGPFCIQNGGVDINCDGTINGSDTGSESGVVVTGGRLDVNGDGVADASDDGAVAGSAPAVVATDGMIDLDHNGVINDDDDGNLTLLELPPAWGTLPLEHIASLVDHGPQGTAAARAVKISQAGFDLDSQQIIDGRFDMNGDAVVNGSDDGIVGVDVPVIDGGLDANHDGVVNTADDAKQLWGRKVIDGGLDFDGSGTVNSADDGKLTAQAFSLGTTAARMMQAYLKTDPASQLVPGRRVRGTCDIDSIPNGTVNMGIALPPKSVTLGYSIVPSQGINQVHCFGNVDTTAFDLLLGDLPSDFTLDFDPSNHLIVTAENGSGPNTDDVGLVGIRLCDDPDEDGVCEAGENGTGIPDTSFLLGDPLRDARGRLDHSPSFSSHWANASLAVIDGLIDFDASGTVDGSDDGLVGSKSVINGEVDLNGDGSVTGADDGRFLGRRMINGLVDVNGDGAANGDDDGTVKGTAVDYDTGVPDATMYLDGAQVAVDTKVGLAELAAASASADDYGSFVDKGGSLEKKLAAGVFGIDEFSYSGDNDGHGLSLHYGANQNHKLVVSVDSKFGKYFSDYHPNATLTIDKVPQTWDFFSDLSSEVVYNGSSAIDSVKVNGSIDDTNDANDANGTNVDFDLESLPKDVSLEIAGKTLKIFDGSIDVNGNGSVGSADDAVIAGVRIIDGGLDLNGDGTVDGSDDGRFIGIDVINGGLDVNADGTVDGNDDGHRSGAMLRMNAGIDDVTLELSSSNKIIETDGYQLIQGALHDVPAQWDANWGGGAFLLESRDASGNPSPLGQVTALVSTSNDATTNANKRKPFTEAGDLLGGAVLGSPGASGGCRFGYSEFLQEIDSRYYSAGGATGVLTRLPDLYCHSETLDTGEDHAIARTGDVNGDGSADEVGFASLQFTGFQKIAWIPDSNGGHFTFKAPTPGLHPIFGGYEKNGTFTTVEVANIPDSVEVDIDKTEHVTEDATDDTDASVGRIGFYTGPLPVASDGDSATRAVVQFDATPVHTTDFIHIGWAFGFPSGGAFFDSSKPIEGRLLTQDGSFRIAAGARFEDLLAAYAVDLLSFRVTGTVCLTPIPFDGCATPEIPVAWALAEAKAGISNDADGMTPSGLLSLDPTDIAGNGSKEDVAGWVAVYQRHSSLASLDPAGPAPGSSEYVPLITAEEKDFNEFSVDLLLELDPTNPGATFYPFDLEFTPKLTGKLVFDVWSPDDTSFVVDLSVLFLGDVGLINPPDYSENSPFHIIPGLFEDPVGNAIFVNDHDLVYRFNGWHHFSDHFDPFGP